MDHYHPFACFGEDDRILVPCGAGIADTNCDTFHILLYHMQLHQSSETLTWHVISG
jgi:hypothetical protein